MNKSPEEEAQRTVPDKGQWLRSKRLLSVWQRRYSKLVEFIGSLTLSIKYAKLALASLACKLLYRMAYAPNSNMYRKYYIPVWPSLRFW